MKKIFFLIVALFLCANTIFAQDQYLGEIKLFAGNFAPKGWLKCDGQLLPISQNQALFSLLGTNYGGDGRTTFGLPDYRGRTSIGASPENSVGTQLGQENVYLTANNLPNHSHNIPFKVSSNKATNQIPAASVSIGSPSITVNSVTRDMLGYNNSIPDTSLKGNETTTAGTTTNTPVNVMQPYLAVTYIIAIKGIFPSRD